MKMGCQHLSGAHFGSQVRVGGTRPPGKLPETVHSSLIYHGLLNKSDNLVGARPELTTERGGGTAIPTQGYKQCL
jgi:hypothetical protein